MNTNNGWQLVPVAPTDEMEVAAENDYEQTGTTFPRWKSAYAAMLAAAPASPGSPASTVADEGAKDEQAAFEEWFERTCPSGDVESVQRQWEASSEYEDLHAEAPAAGDARALAFVQEVAQQKPEKPDHWSSCGQCASNISQASDLLDEIAASQQGGE